MKVRLNFYKQNKTAQEKYVKRDTISGYVHMKRDTPLPLCTSVNILDDPTPFPQLPKYLMNGLFLNQKANQKIRISYSLKYKHLKKNINGKINDRVV